MPHEEIVFDKPSEKIYVDRSFYNEHGENIIEVTDVKKNAAFFVIIVTFNEMTPMGQVHKKMKYELKSTNIIEAFKEAHEDTNTRIKLDKMQFEKEVKDLIFKAKMGMPPTEVEKKILHLGR